MKNIQILILLVFITLLSACDKSRIYEKNVDFKTYTWAVEKNVDFDVEILESGANQLFVNFRHTYFFKSRNVRLKLVATNPKGEKKTLDLNILMSEPNGMWHSECAGDFCDFKYLVDYPMEDLGKYHFSITQDMRVDPLTEVLAIGIRVEKVETK